MAIKLQIKSTHVYDDENDFKMQSTELLKNIYCMMKMIKKMETA